VLEAAVALPFLVAALTPLTVRLLDRSAAYVNAAVLAVLALVLAREAGPVLAGADITSTRVWLDEPRIELALRLDALALAFALVVLVVGVAVLAYAARYFARGDERTGRIVALLTVFAGAMLGLVLADDLVLLFVMWEATSVTSFFLIAGRGEGARPALRAFLLTAIGGLALLAAVALVTASTGSTSVAATLAATGTLVDSPVGVAVALLVILAAGTKSAQLPLHFWLPGAMVAPTPVSTYLHAATMVKAGVYLLLRAAPSLAGLAVWDVTLVVVGGTTAVVGAWIALTRDDLKALLAYSTISQLGLLVALVGIGTPSALAAAGLHVVAHAAFKATLFMAVGIVDHETGTRSLARLGGLARTLPVTFVASALAALSMAGIAPLLGFVTKEKALETFLEAPGATARVGLVLVVLASIGTVAYSLRLVVGTFLGPVVTPAHRAPLAFELPGLVLAVAGLVGGLAATRLAPLASALAGKETVPKLWHGLTPALGLTAVAIVAGALAWSQRDRLDGLSGRLRPGAERFDVTYAATLAGAARIAAGADRRAPAAFLLPVAVAAIAVLVVGAATVPILGSLPASGPTDWAIVLLLVPALGGVVQARSRIAAVGALGLTGFLVAAWFVLHGAPDLALTQLLVETLTVALVVLVFRRLPVLFDRGGRVRHLGGGLIALAAGGGAAALTLLLTNRRPRHGIADRFLAEAEAATGGTNVVNTILVDFRALDTLGEIAVVAVAALGILALVRLAREDALLPERPDAERSLTWLGTGAIDSMILRVATDLIAPVLAVASVWLLLRGHDRVGGGFIGGLAAGAAIVLLYLSRGHEGLWQHRVLRTLPLVGVGLAITAASGLIGLALDGSYLAGGKLGLGRIEVARSLVFDVGLHVVVVALVVSVLRHLGQGLSELPPAADRGGPTERTRA
jgi:multicomponent Na+:H+ antiporter subunit A